MPLTADSASELLTHLSNSPDWVKILGLFMMYKSPKAVKVGVEQAKVLKAKVMGEKLPNGNGSTAKAIETQVVPVLEKIDARLEAMSEKIAAQTIAITEQSAQVKRVADIQISQSRNQTEMIRVMDRICDRAGFERGTYKALPQADGDGT